MPVSRPSPEDLIRIAADYHFSIPPDRMAALAAVVDGFLAPYDDLNATDEPQTPVRYPRAAAQWPAPEDNPAGAWYVRTRIEGAPASPAQGAVIGYAATGGCWGQLARAAGGSSARGWLHSAAVGFGPRAGRRGLAVRRHLAPICAQPARWPPTFPLVCGQL
jgi:hypothetical protein